MRMQLPDLSQIGRHVRLCDSEDLLPEHRNQEGEVYGFLGDDKIQVKLCLKGQELYPIVYKDYCTFLNDPA
jgi:hypothetical protein